MNKNTARLAKIAVIAAAIALVLLCWAPWLSNDFVLKQYNWKVIVPGALNADDAAVLSSVSFDVYEVSWAPFGRLVKTQDTIACGFLESTSAYDKCAANNTPSYVNLFGGVVVAQHADWRTFTWAK